ncbi:MAG TPA: C4-type zinc ribbon domain-containing protein [Vicinamibacteria bacterium]|nr:C4-type zinc ribbon domain-containing protein [Vicinamibacteria bacterium]
MDPDLEKLIRLQRAESELRRVEVELGEIPKVRSALESRLAGEKARLEAARAALDACQKSRRQHEAGLQDLEVKRSKYKGQLMEVKTNKEYTAVLHEIENVEREIRALEDQILLEMEQAESLAAELKREEGLFKAAQEEGQAEARALEARARILEGEAGKLGGERDAIAATIPADALALFQRVARLRGAGVAEARDGMCQLCHVKLRPQMYVDLKKNEGIMQCPACSRILYYSPPVPVVSPEP